MKQTKRKQIEKLIKTIKTLNKKKEKADNLLLKLMTK
jgi:hypothetical protein